jgi:hypothetical protein
VRNRSVQLTGLVQSFSNNSRRVTMSQTFFPVEAVSSLWELICFAGTLFAVATAWLMAPR